MYYMEAFVLQNALADAGLLFLTAAWRGGRVSPLRIALGALLGAAWALAAAMAGGALSSLWLQGAVSALMVMIALGRRPYRKTLQSVAALWLGAATLGGVTSLGVPSLCAILLVGVGGCYLTCQKRALPPPKVLLMIRQGEKVLRTDAIVDTGNRALDPYTHLPVIFIPAGSFTAPGQTLLIKTAAGIRAMTFFTPDELTVNGRPVSAVVALAPKENLHCALVPASLCTERTVA